MGIYFPLFYFLLNNIFYITAKPVNAQSTCQNRINNTIQIISSKGVKVDFVVLKNFYYERQGIKNYRSFDMLSIKLYDYQYHQTNNILNSKILMKNWAEAIFKDCEDTGYISFSPNNTMDLEDYSIFAIDENDNIFVEECKNSPSQFVNPASKVEINNMINKYCAFILLP